MVQEYQSISSIVEITWSPPQDLDPQVDYYHYQLIDKLSLSLVMDGNTSNTSAILDGLPYNHDLSFSLTAVNCIGRTSPITYHNINIGKIHAVLWLLALKFNSCMFLQLCIVGCLGVNSSLLQMSSNFSQAPGTNLSLSCMHNQSIQTIITCRNDGQWEPNPRPFHLLCEFHDIVDESELCFYSGTPDISKL